MDRDALNDVSTYSLRIVEPAKLSADVTTLKVLWLLYSHNPSLGLTRPGFLGQRGARFFTLRRGIKAFSDLAAEREHELFSAGIPGHR